MPFTAALAIKKPALRHASYIALHQPRRPRAIDLNIKRRPCKEVAAERIREFLWEIGLEMEHEVGWKAHAARKAGLKYHTAWDIIQGHKTAVGPDVVDQISLATGCPVGVFYDAEA